MVGRGDQRDVACKADRVEPFVDWTARPTATAGNSVAYRGKSLGGDGAGHERVAGSHDADEAVVEEAKLGDVGRRAERGVSRAT